MRNAGREPVPSSGPLGRLRSALPPALVSTSRRARWRRSKAIRVLCALLAGGAVWLLASQWLPVPEDLGEPVVVAVRDLPIGTTVAAEDLRLERRPGPSLPAQVLDRVDAGVGRVTAGPVGAGEVVTPARFRGPAQLAGLPADRVAVSVLPVESGLLAVIRPADRVVVLAAGTGQTVAPDATVLSVDVPAAGVLGQTSAAGAGHVVLALTRDEARTVAASLNAQLGPTGFVLALHAR